MVALLSPDSAVASAAEGGIAVVRLLLRDFRNYRFLDARFDAPVVVLAGPNGAGKTNLLEALSLLGPGRGLRGARLADIDRRGGAGFQVTAELSTPYGPSEIRCWHEPHSGRRQWQLDGRGRDRRVLGGFVPLLWATPDLDRLFADPPAARRRFLDRLVAALDPDHRPRVAAFERGLRERAQLLQAARPDPLWLGAVERRLAELGVAIAAARLQLVRALEEELERTPPGFPRPMLRLCGALEEAVAGAPALEVEGWLQEQLKAGRARDAESGGASLGPHRSDWTAVVADSGEPAAQASTGRQKALVLALLLAQARLMVRELGVGPLVLLDEFAAHLDAQRRMAFLGAVLDLSSQIWLTGTEPALFEALSGRALFVHIRDGLLVEVGFHAP